MTDGWMYGRGVAVSKCDFVTYAKAHVLLCMLAYSVEHHMRARLGPLLYDDTDREAAAKLRNSVVA